MYNEPSLWWDLLMTAYALWTLVLCLGVICSLFLTLVGLPGNWLIVISALVFALAFPVSAGPGIGWTVVAVIAGIALVGELLEFLLGAAGIAKGGSKRGAILGIVGSFIGSFLGASLGSIVPVLGTLVGIILGAATGAMTGAFLGEVWMGKSQHQSLEIGKAAFWGRLFGSVLKILIGAVIAAVTITAALL